MTQPYTEKILKNPSPSWLDGDINFYMRSRNLLRRRRNLGWLLTYRPGGDIEGFGPQFPTWNVTSALVYPDGTLFRQSQDTPKHIGCIGIRPCTLNSLHSAKLDTERLDGPEGGGSYLHSYTAENIGVSILTAAGRALGHTVLCAPNNDRIYSSAVTGTLAKLGFTPNTTDIAADGGGFSDYPDVWDYGANELLIDEIPPITNGLHFPALRPYTDSSAYRLMVSSGHLVK